MQMAVVVSCELLRLGAPVELMRQVARPGFRRGANPPLGGMPIAVAWPAFMKADRQGFPRQIPIQ
jgi:hypothetical protein